MNTFIITVTTHNGSSVKFISKGINVIAATISALSNYQINGEGMPVGIPQTITLSDSNVIDMSAEED